MANERLYFIDRLRFFAVIILIFFHTALIFASQSNFPIKNEELSVLLEELAFFFHGWRLALLFFISGVGTSIGLSFRTKSTYVKERLKRLLIPLLFGIVVVVPPQIYFERLSQGFAFDSFGSFYLQSFSTGLYPYGNISWNHLWFVAYLLIYSILSIPLFIWIKKQELVQIKIFMQRGGIILWSIPLAVVLIWLKPFSLGVQNIVDDLAMFFFYGLVFIAGFAVHEKGYWRFIEVYLLPLTCGALLLTVMSYFIKWSYPQMDKDDFIYLAFNGIKAVNAWLWILVLLSVGKKFLNSPGKYLSVLNESVYPIYILHQTVIICLGYYIVQQSWTVGTKYLFITFATLLICWILFLVLRTSNVTRVLFGMKRDRSSKKSAD